MDDNEQYLEKAKGLVAIAASINAEDLYIVWFAKTLQNWKALISTDVESGLYFEVTHNGNKAESYIDSYRKISNISISDEAFVTTK